MLFKIVIEGEGEKEGEGFDLHNRLLKDLNIIIICMYSKYNYIIL